MQIGTILVVLSLSMFLATFILRPFFKQGDKLETLIDLRVVELREAEGNLSEAHFCSKCGHRLTSDDRFCSQCGQPVTESK